MTPRRIELERAEDEARARRHGPNCTGFARRRRSNRRESSMQPTTGKLLAIGFVIAFARPALAQTAPLPGVFTGDPAGFLPRSAFLLSLAGMQTDDPR